MKRNIIFWSGILSMLIALVACSKEESSDTPLYQNDYIEYDANRKILVTYFSWGGTTQYLAENIAEQTGGTLFRIETATPYPTDYNECTEVAREELDNGTRPELGTSVENFDEYDVVFVGCPVWWHTAPMAIWSFLESSEYDFTDKIIVPFCTYSATYREETLAKIVELTPGSLARFRYCRTKYGGSRELAADNQCYSINRAWIILLKT